ncbi:MAG: hypothetical protein ABI520_05265 [Caldimonas sp.]
MRESVFSEVRLRRFDVWRAALAVVAAIAIATLAAWAMAMLDSQSNSGRASVVALAIVLGAGTAAIAVSLARAQPGLLACREGVWTFAPDAGAVRTGALEVAIDLGAFLLIRLGEGRRASVWLPVQRRGLESQWHALRCAVYGPPPAAAGAPSASPLSSE